MESGEASQAQAILLAFYKGLLYHMSKTATIRTRIEPSLKREVEDILCQSGLTASETVHLLYRQIKLQRGLPFEVQIPNALTARTLRASKAGKNVKRFAARRNFLLTWAGENVQPQQAI